VIALSGAHAYGFPSPDSDLDLKGVHVDATGALLSLSPPATSASRAEVIEGVEIDYSSNEIGTVLAGLLVGNGNYFERILGPIQCVSPPAELADLRALARAALSRRIHRHYSGFARNQLAAGEGALQSTDAVPAKRILYVLRTALTGLHVLRTGVLDPNLSRLIDQYDLSGVRTLIEAKRAGEKVLLPRSEAEPWHATLATLLTSLDDAVASSPLPAEAPNRNALEQWLLELRKARFA
jgi:uncharacterized protein